MVRVSAIRLRAPLLALATMMAVVGASSRLSDAGAATKLPAFPQGLTIVAFGSSSTQGVGASTPAAAYPAQLQSMLRAAAPRGMRVDVLNRGIGGEDVDDMLLRFERDVLAAKPDIVIWQTGSNDVLRGVPMDRFEAKTRAGLARLRSAGITSLLMEPQWCPRLEATGKGDQFRDLVRRIGADMGVAVIRRSDLMHDWVRSGQLTMGAMLSPDGLHMGDAGYHLLAARVSADVLRIEAARALGSKVSAPGGETIEMAAR